MRNLLLFLTTLLFTTATSATPCQSNGVLCETLKRPRGVENYPRQICVLSSDGFEPIWYLHFGNGLPQRLEKIPDSMMTVYDIRVSPSQKFLAISSAGEGHPYLTVVTLESLLQQQPPPTLVELNPYPGSINFIRWESKPTERLIVESDRLLTEQNQDLYAWQKFAIELPSGKKTALSPDLQQLIPYYVKLLRRHEAPTAEIIDLLVNLATGDRKKLLQQAFDQEKVREVKMNLAKILDKVNSK